MTSIDRARTPRTQAQEVKMILASLKKVLVIVEGKDDQKLYRKVFDSNATLFFTATGCYHFEEIIKANSKSQDKFIIIKDSDFEGVLGNKFDAPNLFRTDGHDAEMMTISDSFWDSFKDEFLNGEDKKLAEVKSVDKAIENLSFCKLYNVDKNLSLEFLPTGKFYDGKAPVDLSKCISTVNSHSSNRAKKKLDVEVLKNYKKKYFDIDYKDLTNGHDMCDAIIYKYKEMMNKSFKLQTLCSLIRMKYTYEDFQKTRLYAELVKWSEKNNRKLLK